MRLAATRRAGGPAGPRAVMFGRINEAVTAIIKPFKLDDVRAALSEIGVSA